MRRTALDTVRGPRLALGGAAMLALIAGTALLPAPASAGERLAYLGDALDRGAPVKLEEVRRRVIVEHNYLYDPYYYGPAYYPVPVVPYAPAAVYPPPVVYAPVPPVDYDDAPGPDVAIVGPRGTVVVGY